MILINCKVGCFVLLWDIICCIVCVGLIEVNDDGWVRYWMVWFCFWLIIWEIWGDILIVWGWVIIDVCLISCMVGWFWFDFIVNWCKFGWLVWIIFVVFFLGEVSLVWVVLDMICLRCCSWEVDNNWEVLIVWLGKVGVDCLVNWIEDVCWWVWYISCVIVGWVVGVCCVLVGCIWVCWMIVFGNWIIFWGEVVFIIGCCGVENV